MFKIWIRTANSWELAIAPMTQKQFNNALDKITEEYGEANVYSSPFKGKLGLEQCK